jgi:acetylornithine/succinyldiaminopimelate/putrescine aminotransferase
MAKKAGQYLLDNLKKLKSRYSFITEVRGRGLLVAVYFNKDIGQDVLTACLQTGVLINRLKPNAIRLMPPLTITNKEIDEGLARLDKALATIKV